MKIARIFIFFISFLWFSNTQPQLLTPMQELTERYKNDLNNQYTQIMQQFFTLFGVSAYEFEIFKQTCIEPYEQQIKNDIIQAQRHQLTLSPPLQEKIREIIAKANIKHPVDLMAMRSAHGSYIEAMLRIIFIDETIFYRVCLNDSEIEATLWHEIQHIVNQDGFIVFCLAALANKILKNQAWGLSDENPTLGAMWQRLRNYFFARDFIGSFNALKHMLLLFQEKRADLLSGLVDVRYPGAWVAIAQRLVPDDNHPHPQDRIEYMQKLGYEIAQVGGQ